jgi:preprotein translocase subunit YajC
MGAFVAIIYFLLIRPKVQQEKRHRERIAQVKRGDKVVTAGGIVGEVVKVKDDELTIKSGESKLVVHRDRIGEVQTPGTDEGTSSR